VGEAKESLPVMHKGREFSIAFNPEFLMAPLRPTDRPVGGRLAEGSQRALPLLPCALPDHYEGRSWRGFHHHIVMSAIAYLFILTTYLAAK
jgi:hypothetical protein